MRKLRTYFFIILSLFFLSPIYSQLPSVPSRMTLGNMRLVITESGKKDIEKDIRMLRASDRFYKIKLDRMSLYMPIIERIFKEEGIPDEIKYLAIQESALISDAVSSSKAVGFWQFKDFTAREVGMRVDNKVDERMNIVSSTYGAARYFKNHQKSLKNWAHTVTAHMTGLGGIKKYTNSKDYGSGKMTITSKSHWYLKRFLAHKLAFEPGRNHQNSEGLALVEYKKSSGKDLRKIANEFKVEADLLKHYNKWLKHGKIPGDKVYTVVVPVKKGSQRARSIARKDTKPESAIKPLSRTQESRKVPPQKNYPSELAPYLNQHKVATIKVNGVKAVIANESDDFTSLLKKSGLSPKKFLKINDLSQDPTVNPGDIFFVKRKKSTSPIGFHVVQPGQTLRSISQQYGIKSASLAKMNRISVIDELQPGRVLWMKAKRPSKVPVEIRPLDTPNKKEIEPTVALRPEPVKTKINNETIVADNKPFISSGDYHIVEVGETLWRISKQYGVTVEELRKWNGLTKYDPIKPNQKLALRDMPAIPEKKTVRPTKTYTVQAGDTLYRIAKAHNMEVSELIAINKKKNSDIDVGETLQVYR